MAGAPKCGAQEKAGHPGRDDNAREHATRNTGSWRCAAPTTLVRCACRYPALTRWA